MTCVVCAWAGRGRGGGGGGRHGPFGSVMRWAPLGNVHRKAKGKGVNQKISVYI